MRIRNPCLSPSNAPAVISGRGLRDCSACGIPPELRFSLDEGTKRGLELIRLIDAAAGESADGESSDMESSLSGGGSSA